MRLYAKFQKKIHHFKDYHLALKYTRKTSPQLSFLVSLNEIEQRKDNDKYVIKAVTLLISPENYNKTVVIFKEMHMVYMIWVALL